MDVVHVDVFTCDFFSAPVQQAFEQRRLTIHHGKDMVAGGHRVRILTPATLKGVDLDEAGRMIDSAADCPVVEVLGLPKHHFVRRANGGRPCLGVFAMEKVGAELR